MRGIAGGFFDERPDALVRKAGAKWIEALPVGSGRMAAMVFGGTEREQLQLNEATLYSGEAPADLRLLTIANDYDFVVRLLIST